LNEKVLIIYHVWIIIVISSATNNKLVRKEFIKFKDDSQK